MISTIGSVLRRFLLFILIGPIVELVVIVLVAKRLGVLTTLLLVAVTSVIGFFLIRSEGIAALRDVQRDVRRGTPPSLGLMNGVLRVLGAVFLALPGLISSVVGLLLLIPPIRRVVAPLAVARLAVKASAAASRIRVGGVIVDGFGARGRSTGGDQMDGTWSDGVIDTEGWDVEDDPAGPPKAITDGDPGRHTET